MLMSRMLGDHHEELHKLSHEVSEAHDLCFGAYTKR